MTHKFPHLCSPITIAGRTFSNRMFSAMGGTDITNDGCIGPKSTAFLRASCQRRRSSCNGQRMYGPSGTDGSHAYHLDTTILNSLAAATCTADAISRHGQQPAWSCPIPVCMQELI